LFIYLSKNNRTYRAAGVL